MKFIVVDDNKTFREGIKYYLENILFHEVIGVATDGEEFLKMKNSHESDIILMDIEMPNLNGIDTIKKALWNNSYLKFIAITNYTHKAYLLDLITAGFKACIFKQNVYDELENTINAVIKNQMYFPRNINLTNDKDILKT
jgi:DNA-binding NarL/FixJ family response regulator